MEQILRNREAVLEECNSELWRNVEGSDVHSEADMAADVVEFLIRNYRLVGFNRDGEWSL